MANTKQAAKRARQSTKRALVNQVIDSATKTAVKTAVDAIKKGDVEKAKTAYLAAVRALSKASSKGTIPRGRAARKLSRLTLLAKKALPASLNFKN